MDRFFHHVLRGLVVVLGLSFQQNATAQAAQGCTLTNRAYACADRGHARAAIEAARASVDANTACLGWVPSGAATGVTQLIQPASNTESNGSYSIQVLCTAGTITHIVSVPPPTPRSATYTSSCSTRPDRVLSWTGGPDVLLCDVGCEMTSIGASGVELCFWGGGPGERVYQCTGPTRSTGSSCSAGPPASSGPRPPDPDRDGDGTPNSGDDAPDDPACQVNCGPQPPPPPPEPPPPDDGQDDGGQLAGELGPRLDAIEQAVLGLGPRIDGVRAAVDAARADANADADGIRSALDGIRSAIVAQGPNVPGANPDPGEGDGPPDLSPLNPGPDGGEHPSLDAIIEQGDAGQLLGQLDTDGFGFGRSCPAYAWPLSFDLGWANINIQQSVGIVCTALAILGFIIGLAGLIQASFILGRIGAT